ncbi:serine/threonine-protein kinase [Actinoplanes sp. NBRC 103695]|uniref:serine/threonine-protein kinase n=1 Tax=Actinoplanes sp. NBRC 103695 TaxID=3032202 RepID=UPI002556D922|nr:serine/threonine-protein kinase [Actinoplanes sp. NBRC 103695]
MTTRPATVQDRYRLGRELGAGGMGRVWLARDETLDRDVAVKEILLPDEMDDRDSLRRHMLLEARASARLSHENVVRVYDAFETDGRAWIVMEYVPSRSLQQVLDADGPMPPEQAARVGLAVLAALSSAHSAGVRHRDVKPANVLLADDGRVVLTDFGVAAVDGESIATSSGLVVGSPQYMAPERIRDGHAGESCDLWSLGATLYAAVEGRPPYQRASVMETVTAIAADEPEPMQQAGALLPAIEGLLRKDPEKRIDAAEARRRLRAVLARPARRRWPFWLAAATVVLIAAAAVAMWAISSPRQPQKPPAAAPALVPSAGPPSSAPADPPGSAPASTPASAPASAAPTGSALPKLPAGWRDYKDPTGFRVYVPEGWNRSEEGTMVYFRGDGRVLGIGQTRTPQPDPVADWKGKAEYRKGRGDFPGYRQIHIQKVDYFQKAADWEFTFNGSGTRQHVNNRGFVTSKKQAYGIWWQTSDSSWAGARDDLDLIFRSFRPR